MLIEYHPSTSIEHLSEALTAMSVRPEVKSLYLLGCDENQWTSEAIDPVLQAQVLPLMGGIFPRVIHQQSDYTTGYVLVGLYTELNPVLVEGLSDSGCDYEAVLDEAIDEEQEFSTMLVIVDGLSSRISAFVDSLFAIFGSEINYIGGGAGSLSFQSKPCVLTNRGAMQDAAVLGLLKESVPIQVGHGWRPYHTGHLITEVEKNVVKEIDYKNALEVYADIIAPHLKDGEGLNKDNFFTNAQSFPLGIKRADSDYIVRDPIAIDDEGALICVGELTKGDRIDILTAQPEDLIASAGTIAQASADEISQDKQVRGVMLIDCISRALFLQETFQQELAAARAPFGDDSQLFGALVLGEIANSGAGYLEFYNKTSVITHFQ